MFTHTMTDTNALDETTVQAYGRTFMVAYTQENVMDQLVQYRADINAKAIELPIFTHLPPAVDPLVETSDVNSVALGDAKVVFTPREYGNVVTTTNLASLQTGGKINLAKPTIVGQNWSHTMDQLAINALNASTNVHIVGNKAEGSVLASDVASGAFLNVFYNRLARASIPTINGSYVMVAHDDVIADLRSDVTAGSWTDVTKYAAPDSILRNEVGMYKGFRVIRNNRATFAAQTGAVPLDIYNSYFLGFNALGKVTSQPGRLVITGPFDKLGRFVNLGWYEVTAYGIVDQAAAWVGRCASSVGAYT